MKKQLFLFIFIGCMINLVAQKETFSRVELFGSASTGENTPFWMLQHNWGMVPLKANNFYVKGGVFHGQQLNKDWSFNTGLDLAGSSPHAYGDVWVQQLYGELNWKFIRLNVGSKEDYTSMVDPYLSTGDFEMSNNARPMPEAKISFPDFVLIPGSKGNVYIKGDFAIGKYMDGQYQEDMGFQYNQDYAKDFYAHHKSVYFRFGTPQKNKVQFILGIDNQAQYGGAVYKYDNKAGKYNVTKQPEGFDDFLRVVFAKEGSSKSGLSDSVYVAGSQVGAYFFKFDYQLKDDKTLSLYLQHFFEDGSGMGFKNYQDMLLGLQYQTHEKNWLSNLILEYVYTKNQTGPVHFTLVDDEHKFITDKKYGSGNDNYYNHVDYTQGRSYYGKSLGTSSFLAPEYNGAQRMDFTSSRVIVFHLGAEGYILPNLKYRLLASTGQSWGTYFIPYTAVKNGFASSLELMSHCQKLAGLDLKLSLGFNSGDFFGEDTFGAGITIAKKFNIKK